MEKIEKTIEEILKENIGKKGVLIQVLQEVQAKFGYVSKENIEKISKELDIPESDIFGVITFYSQFRLEQIGKNLIKVCHGTACHVGGTAKITEIFESKLNIKTGQTTKDKKFTLEKVACLGCCSLAPVVTVNDEVFANVKEEDIDKIIKKFE